MKALCKRFFIFVLTGFVLFTLIDSAIANSNTAPLNAQNIDDDNIDESYMDKALHALIYGKTCEDKSDKTKAERIILPAKGAINVSDKATIDTKNYADAKVRFITFNGEVLRGGIFDSTQNLYLSADKKFSYNLNNDTLEVKAICEKQSFTLTHFTNGDFGLNLSQNPTKEVAIVLNVNNSMWRYTNALKDIAPFLAKHILGDSQSEYAKISLITFSYMTITDLGTFYDTQSFTDALGRAKGRDSNDAIFNNALIEAMRNFTKDNGLKKEVYLITNGRPGDMYNAEKMLTLTQNLNANIVKNTTTNADNRVKIHTFALSPNLDFLKKLAQITGGTYNEANNAYNFKKQILTISNDGKPFDMRELNNEIRPSKTNKIYDPDNPNNPPKKR